METSNKIKFIRPADSCHWYSSDGTPQYERKTKNGNMRQTTLADARKENLYPSVTTILKTAARPGLDRWIQNQILLAALTLPRIENEPEEKWIERVIADSAEHGRSAAALGTNIHAAIQGYYEGSLSEEYTIYYSPAIQALKDKYGDAEWIVEKSFAHPLRFGGKVDLHSKKINVINDIKTKEFVESDIKKGLSYDEHIMQIAAYRIGLEMENATCSNTFVSTKVPGLVHIEEYYNEDLNRAWEMFMSLFHYWKLKNRF